MPVTKIVSATETFNFNLGGAEIEAILKDWCLKQFPDVKGTVRAKLEADSIGNVSFELEVVRAVDPIVHNIPINGEEEKPQDIFTYMSQAERIERLAKALKGTL